MKRYGTRLLAFLLVVCCLLQTVVFSPLSRVSAANSATYHGNFAIEGVSIDYDGALTALDDGRFHLTLRIQSAPFELVRNTDVRTAESGTYRISKAGWYLVELWGGDGADGGDTTASGGSAGGKGGKGGHLYAEVYFEQDQVLFYTLGGNGTPTHAAGEGGGVNGDGGHHGASGGDTVGGGGGYSALFLYDYDEIINKYGTRFITAIDEADRLSRYFMIAGGGGGGGAGNGTSLLGTAATGRADGGAGGSLVGSPSGVISGTGIVSGTFYAGANGKSSGTSLDYIGRGGTNLPGALPKTWLSGVSGSEPNDWAATAHPDEAGGSGGSGNLRGGAGGAGFTGGSGGVMTGTIIPTNVGGGGGGASFLGSSLNGQSLTKELSDEARAYLRLENPSETGGALCITYLGDMDAAFLSDMSLSAVFSPYFEPVGGGFYDRDGNLVVDTEKIYWTYNDKGEYELHVNGASLLTEEGAAGGRFSIDLYLEPISGFAGGNNVPIFDGYAICVASAYPDEERFIDFSETCGYVNVPLHFPISTHNYKAGEPGEKFYVDDLFTDDYADVRHNMAGDARYDFIASIGEMTLTDTDGTVLSVTDENGNPTAVYPQKTTAYRVSLPVTLKDTGIAAVGRANAIENRIVATATVDVMTSISDTVGDYEVTYNKSVVENGDGTYTLSVNMTSSAGSSGEIVPEEGVNHHQGHETNADGFEHPIAVSGYYLVRLWAGNGGDGAASLLSALTRVYGGTGGTGGNVDAYLHLEKGWYVKGLIGKNGGTGSSNDGGTGGGYTYMEILDENKTSLGVLAVAAGGGGGGGAYWFDEGEDGASAGGTDSSYTGTLSDYTGGKGGHGNSGDGVGGTARNNFLATEIGGSKVYATSDRTALTKETAITNLEHALAAGSHASTTGGGVGIHFLMSDRTNEAMEEEFDKIFSEYTVVIPVSPYFEVVSASGSDLYSETGDLRYDAGYQEDDGFRLPDGTLLPNGVTHPAYVAGEGTTVYFANINPFERQERVEEGTEHFHLHVYVDFTVSLTVRPAEGFFGGNDVPLYDSAVTLYHRQYHTVEGVETPVSPTPSVVMMENYATDYVNVAVPKAEFTLTGNDVYYDGTDISRGQLFTVEGQLPFDDWAADFAATDNWRTEFVNLTNTLMTLPDLLPAPTVTTTYTVTLGVVAKAPPAKATVGTPATGGHKTASATIYVGYAVYYELENITTSHAPTGGGAYYVDKGWNLSYRLSPAEGKYLPKQITVLVGDRELRDKIDYTYNATTGDYTILASAIDGPVTVRARGEEKSYTVYFYYMPNPTATTPVEVKETYEAGADLSGAFFKTFLPAVYEGYEFVYDFGDGSSVAPTVMPNGDLWVIGLYVVRTYELTIRYIDEKGTVFDTYTASLPYGEKYSVSSPIVDKKTTETPLVEGVMPAKNVVVDVYYEKSSNVLTILYLKEMPDGSTVKAFETYVKELPNNDPNYSVESPSLPGYTPDVSLVEGSIKDNVTVTVTYRPNRYTVSFYDPSGQVFPSVTVKYDSVYGYYSEDGTQFAYGAFPTPLRAGYVFDGWYDGEARVSEDMTVVRAENHTLTARWTAVSYNVTVRYLNDKGEAVAEEIVRSLPYDSVYSFAVPALYGFTADKLTVEGRVPAQHTVIVVVYTPNGFVLRVQYQDAVSRVTVADTVTLHLRHGDSYEVPSPVVEGYDNCSAETVSGVADAPAMNTELTVTVYYYEAEPVIEVTVEWGTLSFDLTERGLWDPKEHIYAPDRFAPAEAGSNKVTVTNGPSSDISVSAQYSYTPLVGYEGLRAYFTAGGADDARLTEGAMLAPKQAETVFVYVEGNMPTHLATGSYTVGSCTVSLKGGESNE